MKLISIIVPFYNEGKDSVNKFQFEIISKVINKSSMNFELIYINDGSEDDTLEALLNVKESCKIPVKVLDFSRNFGKEAALTAGLEYCKGDAAIPIDADLQDPPVLILDMIQKWKNGAYVVAAKRTKRNTDTFFKKHSANMFYKVHNKISQIKVEPNVGDFRLIDRKVIDCINQLPESQRFMKGLFAWVGFPVEFIEYERPCRYTGNTKFSRWRLWNFALDGLTSFSTSPLKLSTYVGLTGAIFSLSYAMYIIFITLFNNDSASVPGYASIVVLIIFFGSLQLISIGILGEYLGRTYLESKNRPKYIIKEFHGD
ncbi:glycosyltransferase family 2 protein [Vibrio sp. RC27]